ncbi:tyrosine--tRNA ligase [Tribonema minus]|uniref:tyrosine--tRNA ligase n=1 Tax=Tribonema minus TaxID=303371 RepID=A0A835YH37_9STRA|nr:tyrosine--tRNA ligase [Tribonema minus]
MAKKAKGDGGSDSAKSRFVVNPTSKFSVLDIAGTSQPAVAGAKSSASAASAKGPAPAADSTIGAPPFDPSNLVKSELSLQERFDLCRSVAEECIQEDELMRLLEFKDHPIVYDGFEPSGRMHIAQGVMRALNVNKLTKAGCHFKFWVADWFAQLNNKMGGDLAKIQVVGKYMIEIWKAVGMDMRNVQFLWASEEINRSPAEYWGRVMEIARLSTVARIQRCCTIMGRSETEEMSSAQVFYPCMQCADVFYLKADICQLGLDQRKVNMLAREYCDQTRPKIKHKPVILSHHMLAGLKEGQIKMSKSDPDSAIFMEDTPEDLARKVKKAYCPPGIVDANPVLDYCKNILFGYFGQITIAYKDGDQVYTTYEALEADYVSGKLHPSDLKPAATASLNKILQPVRDHFSSGEPAKLLALVKKYKITK